MKTKRITALLLCAVIMIGAAMPALAAQRIYWHDDYNDTISSIGVTGYYEATLTGSSYYLSEDMTLTYIPGTPNFFPPDDYSTRAEFVIRDNGGFYSTISPTYQIGMSGNFIVLNANLYAHPGYSIKKVECKSYVNGSLRHTLELR